MAKRRAAQRVRTRRAILDATERLLLERGLQQFSIRKLVAACGYTAPTIYQHFGDKDGLLDAVIDQRFERLEGRLRGLPRAGDPVEILRSRSLLFIRFGIRNPRHVQLAAALRAREHAPPPSMEEARALLEQPWVELWEAGRLQTGDWQAAAQSLGALCHGIVAARIENPDLEWSKTLAEDAVDALLRGLVLDAPRGTTRG